MLGLLSVGMDAATSGSIEWEYCAFYISCLLTRALFPRAGAKWTYARVRVNDHSITEERLGSIGRNTVLS